MQHMLYTLKRLQNKNPGEKPGFYFIAKKKIFKKAVDRNRVKRIMRHAFQKAKLEVENLEKLDATNYSLVFGAERGIIQESFHSIVQTFVKDLEKFK